LLSYAVLRSLLTPLRMDNQYFVIADTKFLAAYAISLLFFSVGLLWFYKQSLWLPDEDLIEKIALESVVPAKSKKGTKGVKGVKSVKNKKG